jgi:large subunit ribosomal protein L19
VASRGDVRRAKLYYLRGRVGRRARIREQVYTGEQAEEMFEPTIASDAVGTQEEAEPVAARAGEEASEAPAGEEAPEVPSDAEAKETADEETLGTGPEAAGETPPSGGGTEEVEEEERTAEGEETEGAGEPDDAGSQAS